MANVFDITKYATKQTESYFLDNNVWMFLFYPHGNYQKQKISKYSNFFKDLTNSGRTIFINSLVLSEFANAYFRNDFRNWIIEKGLINPDYKKDYVGKGRYLDTSEEISNHIRTILRVCEKSNDDFNAINIENVYSELINCDFNDSYYLELGRLRGYKIVTDDADLFKNNSLSIDIITANV